MKPSEQDRVVKGVLAQLEDGIDINKACKNAGVTRRTLYAWANKPRFEGLIEKINETIRVTHQSNAETAERTLFQRAVGYLYEEKTFKNTGGKELVLEKKVVKARPGDVTALIFLLCNLAREGLTSITWQSVFDIKIDREKLDTLDDLIQKYFAEDDKKTEKGKGSAKAAPQLNPSEDSGIPGESEEERELREGLSLEMSD